MTLVVTEPCDGCKYTDCVEVCPVDCFHEGELMLYIDPETCIDCMACVSMCPVDAILTDEDAPEKWTKINAEMALQLPVIDKKKEPLV